MLTLETINMDIKQAHKSINKVRKYVKPYGYTIRFRVGYYENADYTIELFKGYVHNTNRVWQTDFWYNNWSNFTNDVVSLINYFDKYCKNK